MRTRLSPGHRQKLEALRQTYARELPRKVRDLEEACQSMMERDGEAQSLESAYVLAHRLTGSSATFGFEALRQAASSLETLLLELTERPQPPEAWEARLALLRQGLRDALAASEGAGGGRGRKRAPARTPSRLPRRSARR